MLKVWVNVKGVLCCPESHSSVFGGVPTGPGMQFVMLQVPDVVECVAFCQSHSTVVPTGIVVVLVPLIWSTNCVCRSNPTNTMWFPLGVIVGVNVRVFVAVRVFEFVRVNVKVWVIVGVSVGGAPVGVNVNVGPDVNVRVFVNVGEFVNVWVIDGVSVGVGEGTVGVTLGVSVIVGVSVGGGTVGVGTGGAGGPNAFTRKTAICPRRTGLFGQ